MPLENMLNFMQGLHLIFQIRNWEKIFIVSGGPVIADSNQNVRTYAERRRDHFVLYITAGFAVLVVHC
jgi:hypothetical protein